MSRKVLLAVTIVWAVLLGGAYAVALAVPALTSTTLHTDRSGFDAEKYVWDGQPIVIERAGSKTHTVSCEVTPKNGEKRTLKVQSTTRKYPDEFKSWFSGSATMVCEGNGNAVIHSGPGKTLYQMGKNQAVMIAAIVIAVGPLLAVYVFVPGNRR